MTEDSISRRGFLGKTGVIGATALAGCSAPTSDYSENSNPGTPEADPEYSILEQGETSDELGLHLEKLNPENETAHIYLGAGSTQEYSEGDQIICDKVEEPVGAYLEDIDYEMEEVELRLEQGC